MTRKKGRWKLSADDVATVIDGTVEIGHVDVVAAAPADDD